MAGAGPRGALFGPGRPPHFLPPQSLETRTSVCPPRCPRLTTARQMGEATFRRQRGSSVFDCSVRLQEEATWSPGLGPPSPASTPRSTASCPASSFRAQRPLALHGVGTPQGPWETTEAGEAVVHTTPAPAPRGLRPRALHPAWCSPLASPSPAGVTPSAGWKKPRRSRGPRLSLWVAL